MSSQTGGLAGARSLIRSEVSRTGRQLHAKLIGARPTHPIPASHKLQYNFLHTGLDRPMVARGDSVSWVNTDGQPVVIIVADAEAPGRLQKFPAPDV